MKYYLFKLFNPLRAFYYSFIYPIQNYLQSIEYMANKFTEAYTLAQLPSLKHACIEMVLWYRSKLSDDKGG